MHDAPELADFHEELEPYVGGYNARNVPYWVYIEKETIVGIVVIDKEPLKLIEPLGTKVSVVVFTSFSIPTDTLIRFISDALQLAKEYDAAYSFIELPAEKRELFDHSRSIGYTGMEHSLRMVRDLDDDFQYTGNLKFERIERSEVDPYIEKIKKFMSGSPDEMLNIVLGNIREMPEKFIDHWYEREYLYYIYDEEELIGILDLSPQYLNVSNIGVSPDHRRRGYGKQIMQYALKTLKDMGREHAALRVHVANTNAIRLYESMGFSRAQERIALIWRRNKEAIDS